MKPILICIAGGSASGKTTVVEEIQKKIGKDEAIFIRHDDYYRDSLENDLLVKHLKMLLNGEAIDKPIYDFVLHTRKKEIEHIEPKPIIILEGILVLEDERIRDLSSIKVFVNCDDDVRFIRRLQRDIKERGRSVDSVINQYLTTVKPMYHLFVRPTIRYADIIIPNDREHTIGTQMLIRNIKALIKENQN